MNNVKLWIEGEEKACEYLRKRGYRILERNYKNRYGELDIIAQPKHNADVIVIVEVKAKSSDDYGRPIEMITQHKRKKLEQVTSGYLQTLDKEYYVRFDAIEFIDGQINHIEGI